MTPDLSPDRRSVVRRLAGRPVDHLFARVEVEELVDARAAEKAVGAGAAEEAVGAGAADEQVVAGLVVAGAAAEAPRRPVPAGRIG